MKPFQAALSVIIILLLTSCDEINNLKSLKWGEVDEGKIRRSLEEIAREQNKQKLAELQQKYDIYRSKRDTLSTLSSNIRTEERINCYKLHNPEALKKNKNPSATDAAIAREMRYVRRPDMVSTEIPNPLDRCIDGISNTESVKDIQRQIEATSKHMDDKSKFEREISNISRSELKIIVERYAAGKYDLIVRNDNENILYADKKVRLNLTDDVLAYIQNNKPDLTVKNFLEYSEEPLTK